MFYKTNVFRAAGSPVIRFGRFVVPADEIIQGIAKHEDTIEQLGAAICKEVQRLVDGKSDFSADVEVNDDGIVINGEQMYDFSFTTRLLAGVVVRQVTLWESKVSKNLSTQKTPKFKGGK